MNMVINDNGGEGMKEKKKFIEVHNLKAYTQKSFNENGESVDLKITFHKELITLLKTATTNSKIACEKNLGLEVINEDGDISRESFVFERYAVKRIFFKELYGAFKECIFHKSLFDDGSAMFNFGSLRTLNDFKTEFQDNLKKLIEMLLGEGVKQEIEFKLKIN